MPFGDRTGPNGMGPMTGRAAGYCAGYGVPGSANPVGGRGRGFGFGGGGGGRGWRNRFWATGVPGWAATGVPAAYAAPAQPAPMTTENEVAALRQQADMLTQTLAGIAERLAQIEATKSEEQ